MFFTSIIGASVSEPHLRTSTRPLSVCLYISYVSHFDPAEAPALRAKTRPLSVKCENIIYNTKQYKMKWYRVKQYMRIEGNN